MGNELTEHPSGLKFTEAISSFDCVAINGHEEIVFGGYHSSGPKQVKGRRWNYLQRTMVIKLSVNVLEE